MIHKVTKDDVLNLSGRVLAGIFSNTISGSFLQDTYARQQIIGETINDVQQALNSVGIYIIEDDEN